mmetsp:Transcript_20854/g.62336  ORF Transcript_20854/g.62336 Transcript_20854/m.62336 type:complete len:321 (-) Transcript_20854:405-1367(-)
MCSTCSCGSSMMKLNSSPHSTVPLCAREMLEVRKRDGRVFITQYSSLPLVTSADNSRTLSAPFGGFASPKLGMIGNDMALGSTINWFRASLSASRTPSFITGSAIRSTPPMMLSLKSTWGTRSRLMATPPTHGMTSTRGFRVMRTSALKWRLETSTGTYSRTGPSRMNAPTLNLQLDPQSSASSKRPSSSLVSYTLKPPSRGGMSPTKKSLPLTYLPYESGPAAGFMLMLPSTIFSTIANFLKTCTSSCCLTTLSTSSMMALLRPGHIVLMQRLIMLTRWKSGSVVHGSANSSSRRISGVTGAFSWVWTSSSRSAVSSST